MYIIVYIYTVLYMYCIYYACIEFICCVSDPLWTGATNVQSSILNVGLHYIYIFCPTEPLVTKAFFFKLNFPRHFVPAIARLPPWFDQQIRLQHCSFASVSTLEELVGQHRKCASFLSQPCGVCSPCPLGFQRRNPSASHQRQNPRQIGRAHV